MIFVLFVVFVFGNKERPLARAFQEAAPSVLFPCFPWLKNLGRVGQICGGLSELGIVRRPRSERGAEPMLYALLCYNSEETVFSWSKEEETKVMDRLGVLRERLERQGKLGPSLRLMPTTAATTLRKSDPPMIIDGPFAETKEQLLGFYILDCADLEEALAIASDLGEANPGGAYEIRPLLVYNQGGLPQEALSA